MKKTINLMYLLLVIIFTGCQNDEMYSVDEVLTLSTLDKDKAIIQQLGLDVATLIDRGDAYLLEGDILLKKKHLKEYGKTYNEEYNEFIPLKQGYLLGRLVSISNVKNITVRFDASVPTTGVGSEWRNATLTAMEVWNSIPGSCVKFSYTTSSSATITIKRVYEDTKYAWTTLPLNGKPSNEIFVNSKYDSSAHDEEFNKANTLTHEMGHSLGLLHTHESNDDETIIPGTPNLDLTSIMSYYRNPFILPGYNSNDMKAIEYLYPAPAIESSVKLIGIGGEVIYSLPNLSSQYSWLSIIWEAENATLISGQGTRSAKFKSTTSGAVNIKANISLGNQVAIYEDSNVWCGAPGRPKLSCSGGTRLSANTTYELEAISAGAEKYTWYCASSEISLGAVTTTSNTVSFSTGSSNGMGNIAIITCYATNKYGNSTTSQIRISYQ